MATNRKCEKLSLSSSSVERDEPTRREKPYSSIKLRDDLKTLSNDQHDLVMRTRRLEENIDRKRRSKARSGSSSKRGHSELEDALDRIMKSVGDHTF